MQQSSIDRRAAATGRALMLAAAVLAAGCGEDSPQDPVDAAPEPGDFAVRGMATGLLGPLVLELRQGDDVESLTVTTDGAFAFAARLADGASYAVTLPDDRVPCTLNDATGTIAGADAAVELSCTGPALASLAVSGIAPAVAIVPGTAEYVVELPLSQPAVTLTATAAAGGDTLAIDGMDVASGAPSAELALDLGDNDVDIVVENEIGWQRTYRVNLRRAAKLAQYAYGKASNAGAADQFGHSLALSGDTLAVGAFGEGSAATGVNGNQNDDSTAQSGAVYVFRRSGTAWQQEAYLKASNTGEADRFGASVALLGDVLAVGAFREDSAATGTGGDQDDDSAQASGAVYVFRRSGTTWQQEAYLKASNTGADDQFGFSVGLSGDTLAVGALGEDSAATGTDGDQDDDSAQGSGAVYVFRHDGTEWQQEAYLKASNTGAADRFGASLAISGDTLAVGAHFEDSAATGIDGDQADESADGGGAVYVFRRTGTTWAQEAYLKASNTERDDFFGYAVAVSGDALAVGAIGEDSAASGVNGDQSDNSAPSNGAVYVFRRSGTTWAQEAYLKASSNTGGSHSFGTSLALSGDTLAVGADQEDRAATGVDGGSDSFVTDSGAAYVFRHTDTTWQQEAYVKASNTGANDRFGTCVALSGDTLAIGAALESSIATGVNGDQDDDSAMFSGAVYVFH
jgi:hypothetical protein